METIKKLLNFLQDLLKEKEIKEKKVLKDEMLQELTSKAEPVPTTMVDSRRLSFIRAFRIAQSIAERGVSESTLEGKKEIKEWWARLNRPNWTHQTPWCTLAVYIPLIDAGLLPQEKDKLKSALPHNFPMARAALNPGVPGFKFKHPLDLKKGDIVISWRGKKMSEGTGHIGWFIGWKDDKRFYEVLGGNQKDSFNISTYKSHKILGGIEPMTIKEIQDFKNILV